MNPLSSGNKGQAHQEVMGHSPERGRESSLVLVHLVVLPTLLTGLRGRTIRALGRMCFVRAGACDTLKRGVWATVALRVAGGSGTGVVPRSVDTSILATAGCVGAA